MGEGKLNLSPEAARIVTNLYNANGSRGQLGFEEKNGETGIQLEEFYFSVYPQRQRPLTPKARQLLRVYWERWQKTAKALPQAKRMYVALKEKLAGFLVESNLLPGRKIKVEEWVANPKELSQKADYQTGGNILSLKRLLNVAAFATKELQTRVVLYAGLGANTQATCRFNLVEPLLLTNFDVLIGVEYASLTFDFFREATIRELHSIKDPTSGKYLDATLKFKYVSENVYEANFYYLGSKRTVRAYFGTDINSLSYPIKEINVIFDSSHAMQRDTFEKLVAGLGPKGMLVGQGKIYYHCPSGSCGKIEPTYFTDHFREVTSPGFYELSLADLIVGSPTWPLPLKEDTPRFLIYQKKQ